MPNVIQLPWCPKCRRFRFMPPDCPPDKPELGRATWTFLHTMAAYYPEQPSELQKRLMADFLRGFGTFYPCVPCADDLRKNMILHPPQIQSRDALSGWMCMQHNLVNKKIHKPLFDCSTALERWRYGWKDGSCDPPEMD
ncbi:FAD-linked sulfhydryl oxidase ALR [Fasciola gigantica]|uniref:Sulfhydryl oxidase n=1 Tax=Fasciola gigantica TaxID=46835 RepID=A0A504YTF8_FASGI|nr:FAD-linked sulfhydryl oxidase ALR [Fasciola gigantica]